MARTRIYITQDTPADIKGNEDYATLNFQGEDGVVVSIKFDGLTSAEAWVDTMHQELYDLLGLIWPPLL